MSLVAFFAMLPFMLDRLRHLFTRRRQPPRTRVRRREDGAWLIDVRGQTCPGYLLEINRAVETIAPGSAIVLRISYPPCGDDVHAWCREKGHVFHRLERTAEGHFDIRITSAGPR